MEEGRTNFLALIPTAVAFCLGRSGEFILYSSGQCRGSTISVALGLYGVAPFRRSRIRCSIIFHYKVGVDSYMLALEH